MTLHRRPRPINCVDLYIYCIQVFFFFVDAAHFWAFRQRRWRRHSSYSRGIAHYRLKGYALKKTNYCIFVVIFAFFFFFFFILFWGRGKWGYLWLHKIPFKSISCGWFPSLMSTKICWIGQLICRECFCLWSNLIWTNVKCRTDKNPTQPEDAAEYYKYDLSTPLTATFPFKSLKKMHKGLSFSDINIHIIDSNWYQSIHLQLRSSVSYFWALSWPWQRPTMARIFMPSPTVTLLWIVLKNSVTSRIPPITGYVPRDRRRPTISNAPITMPSWKLTSNASSGSIGSGLSLIPNKQRLQEQHKK